MATAEERWATSVVLGDGDTAYLRPITPADAPLLLAFHERQPPENLYRRFFSPKPTLRDDELARFTNVDLVDRVGLVLEAQGEFVAWASYERLRGRNDAEVAFMVDATQQGKGIATLMLEHLAAIAQHNGIERFIAEVLADNRPMLSVFARAGWPVDRQYDSGVVELAFPLGSTEHFVETVGQREQRADSRAMARLLLPRSVAVIGASGRPHSVGAQLWRNTVDSFDGPVYAVNPAHTTLDDRPCHARVTDIADEVSLAIVAVPPEALESAIDDCIAKRVRGAVIVTSTDPEMHDITAMVNRARRFGMRILGPSSMGIAGGRGPTDALALDATLASGPLPRGNVAFSLQSGTLGASILRHASRLALGVSWFVSLGDKRDVSGNDLLQFWEDDADTKVIAVYTETFGNPRKFARLARRVAMRRPIVTVRTGPAAASRAADALYEQAGLIQVPTVHALLDTARVLATQPMIDGPRVTVITNSRSPGVLTAAALLNEGLAVVPAPRELSWRSGNEEYAAALRAALDDDGVDAVVVIHAPPVMSAASPAATIDEVAAAATKPVVAVVLGHDDGPICRGSAVPSFAFPEPAAAALGRMYRYRRWLDDEAVSHPQSVDGIDVDGASDLVSTILAAGVASMSWQDAERLVVSYGVDVAAGIEVEATAAPHHDEAAVLAAARSVGFPVCVKSNVRGFGRSAEAGVALDLFDEHAVRDALALMRASGVANAGTLLVQRMAHPGVEVRVRCVNDEHLGPVVHVGLGGANAELIGDAEGRLAPLSHQAARRAIQGTRAGAILSAASIDPSQLADTVVRLAQLVHDHPDIAVLDANPVIAGAEGTTVVDLRVVVAASENDDSAMRRLV